MQKVIKPVCESLEEDMKTEKKGKHAQTEFPHTRFRLMLGRLPPRLRWTLHNLVAHPISEVLNLLWLDKASTWVHNHTVPAKRRGKLHRQLEA